MAYIDLYTELRGSVPKIPLALAKTLVNRAYQDIRRQNLWSFQVYDSNWIAPASVTTGLATVVQGSPTVVLGATAAAAVIASITAYNPINQRQFRVSVSSLCNIIAFDGVNTLTLDRGFPDPSGASVAYIIFQAYYPAPYQDHRSFISVRDMVMFSDLILDKNRAWLDERDPQRMYYCFPTHVVPFMTGADATNTSTYQFPMFELWGVPLVNRAYQLYGIRKGVDLVANTDTLPPQITEEAVIALAKFYAYEWAEANKGAIIRNQGPDWRFLMGETKKRYEELFKKLRQDDREFIDNFFFRAGGNQGAKSSYYNALSGTGFPGV